LPALGRAREQAKRVACASNLRQNGLALIMYADDNQGWFPLSDHRSPMLIHAFTTTPPGPPIDDPPPPPPIDGDLLLKRYGMTFKTLSCPSGSWEAKFPTTRTPMVINYFYNCGVGNWPPASNVWHGHWYKNVTTGKFQDSDSLSDRPVLRRQMIDVPLDTALMTDAYLPKNNMRWFGTEAMQWVSALYAGPIPGAGGTPLHPNMPGSHPKPGTNYSAGLNVLMADGSVHWLEHREFVWKANPQYRWDVRPRLRYQRGNNLFW
jgi:prepilin-type processing-associated H-X9-DG protein